MWSCGPARVFDGKANSAGASCHPWGIYLNWGALIVDCLVVVSEHQCSDVLRTVTLVNIRTQYCTSRRSVLQSLVRGLDVSIFVMRR